MDARLPEARPRSPNSSKPPPGFRAALALAAWRGLRHAEICALRISDVDLDQGRVSVRRNCLELLEAPRKFEKDPQSEADKRTVTIPPQVIPLLRQHAREHAGPTYFRSRSRRSASPGQHDLPGVSPGQGQGRADHRVPRPATHRPVPGGRDWRQSRRPQVGTRPPIHRCGPAVYDAQGDAEIADAPSRLAEDGDAGVLPKSF